MIDPSPTGAFSISWSQAPTGALGGAGHNDRERVPGFSESATPGVRWLPDEHVDIGPATAGRRSRGAFVPLVIHEPSMSERPCDPVTDRFRGHVRTRGGR